MRELAGHELNAAEAFLARIKEFEAE